MRGATSVLSRPFAPQALYFRHEDHQGREDHEGGRDVLASLVSLVGFVLKKGASRRGAGLAGCALVALAGCSPKPAPPPQAVQLDCGQGFAAQAAKIAALPGIVPAPKEPGEPYRFYTTADQATSYVVTEPGAPGHPAILMQRASGGAEDLVGCPYGKLAGYAQLKAYVESLKAARK